MNPAPNLILIGPMGAGKSSLGRRLAAHFGLRFVDTDEIIVQHTGASIATIFEYEGEAGFRQRERCWPQTDRWSQPAAALCSMPITAP